MYNSFFGLKRKPFQMTPDPEFLLLGRSHGKTLTFLRYGITETSGFVLVTGEVGTGKTTIIRAIIREFEDHIRLATVNNTKIGSEQLLSIIAGDFGIDIAGKDKVATLGALTSFLVEEHSQRRKCLLIIDEAQNLSPDMLEEMRLLSNLETDRHKLLQIMLAGQPELINTLARPELRQLRQRITVSCHLQPLSESETEEYILHRLEVAGNRGAVKFDKKSFGIIHNFSRGIPRLINIGCDFILLTAFTENTREITAELAREVTLELDISNNYWRSRAPIRNESREAPFFDEITKRVERLEHLTEGLLESVERGKYNTGIPSVRGQLPDLETPVKGPADGPKETKKGNGAKPAPPEVISPAQVPNSDAQHAKEANEKATSVNSDTKTAASKSSPVQKKSAWKRFFDSMSW